SAFLRAILLAPAVVGTRAQGDLARARGSRAHGAACRGRRPATPPPPTRSQPARTQQRARRYPGPPKPDRRGSATGGGPLPLPRAPVAAGSRRAGDPSRRTRRADTAPRHGPLPV